MSCKILCDLKLTNGSKVTSTFMFLINKSFPDQTFEEFSDQNAFLNYIEFD